MPKKKFIFQIFNDPYTERFPEFKGPFTGYLAVEHDIILGNFRDPVGIIRFRKVLRSGVNKDVVLSLIDSQSDSFKDGLKQTGLLGV